MSNFTSELAQSYEATLAERDAELSRLRSRIHAITEAGIAAGMDIRHGDGRGGLTEVGMIMELVRQRDDARTALAEAERDAARWRFARTIFSWEDIERADRECRGSWRFSPNEEENLLTDSAIDAAIKDSQ